MLENKHVTVFVTGGIAVYKAADLVRKFIKAGAIVRVAMTKSATEFVQPLTFQILSRNEVYTDTFDEKEPENVSHIHLADWTELAVIVPATANIIGKVASGIADDMLSTTIMATKAPVVFAPAMNNGMYENKIVQDNIKKLEGYGYSFIEPDVGNLACGYTAKGKLPKKEKILKYIESELNYE